VGATPLSAAGSFAFECDDLQSLPLTAHQQNQTICWRQGRATARDQFLAHVEYLAQRLPDQPFAVNLCEDRYLFMVGFCAALLRGQTNLLPNSRVSAVVSECVRQFPEHSRITDTRLDLRPYILAEAPSRPNTRQSFEIPPEQIAAVLFTSGSTGVPRPHQQRWGELLTRAALIRDRLGLTQSMSIVATVPAQHMFGLETSVLLPLVSGAATDAGRPFFPSDVCTALHTVPPPRVLVTTPVHLRACLKADLAWPRSEFVLSATAPMPRSLAEAAERCFQTPVTEIYGSTETGAMATRRTAREEFWQLCDGLVFRQTDNRISVVGPQLSEGFEPQDRIEIVGKDEFRLLGRQSDLINIAGKRGSVGDLTQKLLEIDGVQDAVILALDEAGEPLPRLCGVVVAPELGKSQILRALARKVDPVFLPRPLHKVPDLGRAESGKLPRSQIWTLIRRLKTVRDQQS